MKNRVEYSSFNMNTIYDYKNLIKMQANEGTEKLVSKKPKVKIKENKLRNR